jgi:hypothetical protein
MSLVVWTDFQMGFSRWLWIKHNLAGSNRRSAYKSGAEILSLSVPFLGLWVSRIGTTLWHRNAGGYRSHSKEIGNVTFSFWPALNVRPFLFVTFLILLNKGVPIYGGARAPGRDHPSQQVSPILKIVPSGSPRAALRESHCWSSSSQRSVHVLGRPEDGMFFLTNPTRRGPNDHYTDGSFAFSRYEGF